MIELYAANIHIRALARSVDQKLTALAEMQNRPKWQVVRAALEEYVDNHKDELTNAAR